MALSGSSIVIVLIGVAAFAVAVPVQSGPNTLQQNENEGLTDFLARYWEDRRMNQGVKRNLDQIGGGHLVRNIDKQFKDLLNEEENRLIQYLKSASDKQILNTIRREGLFADRFPNGNLINSSINSVTLADMISHPHNSDLNAGQVNDQLFMDQLIHRDDNMRKGDRQIVKNLDQIGSRYFTRNLDQIGGGNLVRNLDQIGGGHLVRNLDQIGGGHLVRNLQQIDDESMDRNVDYQNAEMKQRVDERSANILEKQHFTRNLDQIGGGNLVRNLDQIGGGNLVRNLDQIGGGNLVRNLDQIGGGNLVRSFN